MFLMVSCQLSLLSWSSDSLCEMLLPASTVFIHIIILLSSLNNQVKLDNLFNLVECALSLL